MSFTFVQDNSAGATASAGSIAVALTGVTAGNLIAVWVAHEGTATTITVGDGTTTFTPRTKTSHSGGEPHGQWFYLLSANSGNKTYTATFGANRTFRAIAVAEFSYTGGTLAYDTEALNQATSATHTSGNLTTASTDELVLGGLKIFSSATIANHQINGQAADGYENEAGKFIALWRKTFAATFTGAATATSNGGSVEYVCNAIAFKITAAGGSSVPVFMHHYKHTMGR